MTVDEFNAFCGSLPHATHVVQWGGAHVWKIGGKVFAIGGLNNDTANKGKTTAVSFKVSPIVFEVMKNQPGVRPAPYLASRGMMWLQRTSTQTIKDAAFKDHLRESYRLVSLGLTKKVQTELGLSVEVKNTGAKQAKTAPSIQKSSARSRKGTQ